MNIYVCVCVLPPIMLFSGPPIAKELHSWEPKSRTQYQMGFLLIRGFRVLHVVHYRVVFGFVGFHSFFLFKDWGWNSHAKPITYVFEGEHDMSSPAALRLRCGQLNQQSTSHPILSSLDIVLKKGRYDLVPALVPHQALVRGWSITGALSMTYNICLGNLGTFWAKSWNMIWGQVPSQEILGFIRIGKQYRLSMIKRTTYACACGSCVGDWNWYLSRLDFIPTRT